MHFMDFINKIKSDKISIFIVYVIGETACTMGQGFNNNG